MEDERHQQGSADSPRARTPMPAPRHSRSAPRVRRQDPPGEFFPQFRAHRNAAIWVVLLVFVGGGSHTLSLGLTCLIAAAAVFVSMPIERGSGLLRIGGVVLLLALAVGLLPNLLSAGATWRDPLVALGVELPFSLSLAPRVTFETWVAVVAGLFWLLCTQSWSLNHKGRKRLHLWMACLTGVVALILTIGNLKAWHFPGTPDHGIFTLIPDNRAMGAFIAMGGVLAFGYAMEGVHRARLTNVVGLLATFLVTTALILLGSYAALLAFLGGLILWFFLRLYDSRASLWVKLPAIAAMLAVAAYGAAHRHLFDLPNAALWADCRALLGDYWIAGCGAGSVGLTLQFYRDALGSLESIPYPDQGAYRWALETGVLGMIALLLLVVALARRVLPLPHSKELAYRAPSLGAIGGFVVLAAVSPAAFVPANIFLFCLLLAIATRPAIAGAEPIVVERQFAWRAAALMLALFGVVWVVAALFRLPLAAGPALDAKLSRFEKLDANEFPDLMLDLLDELVALDPLEWRYYHERGRILLDTFGEFAAAREEFEKAAAVEPGLARPPFEAGQAWARFDRTETRRAWTLALQRSEGQARIDLFRAMLRERDAYSPLAEIVRELSDSEPDLRLEWMLGSGQEVFRSTLTRLLERDPTLSGFDPAQRRRILVHWLDVGPVEDAVSFYEQNANLFAGDWRLESLIAYRQGKVMDAVERVRAQLRPMEPPGFVVGNSEFVRLKREYELIGHDQWTGEMIFAYYFANEQFEDAVFILSALIEEEEAMPQYVYYWFAELSYRIGDYIRSWEAFADYIRHYPESVR